MATWAKVGIGWRLVFWLPGGVALAWLGAMFVTLGRAVGRHGGYLGWLEASIFMIPVILAVPVIGWLRVPFVMRTSRRSLPVIDLAVATLGVILFGAVTILSLPDGEWITRLALGAIIVEGLALVQLVRVHRPAAGRD